MLGGNTGTPVPAHKNYQLINTPKKASWLFGKLATATRVAVDIETNHPTIRDKDKARSLDDDIVVVGASFSWQKDTAAYIPLYTGFGTESFWKEKHGLAYVLSELEAFLENATPKTLQNGKFDLQWFYKTMGIVVQGFDFDTMLAHHLLDEDGADCGHGLKDMAAYFIDPKAKQYEESLQKALDYYDPTWRRYSRVPIDILYPYACADADFTLQLQDFFEPKLKEENLRWLFDNMTMPLQKTCMYAELKGFTIDMKKVDELAAYYDVEEKRLTAAVYEAAGHEFDIKSSQQLADVLYKELGLPQQHLKSGALTTNKEAMFALYGKHPIMTPLSEIRSISKMKDTYVEGVRKRLDRKTGKLHPNFKVHGSKTGRLASEDPNVQNLPTVAKGGEKIKSQYVAPPGHKWILSDYRQIELVIATHLSQEPAWLSAFANDEDLHSKTAKAVFGLSCPVEDVKKLHEPVRTQAKCFHPDTEVLTRRGWVKILDLKPGEEVAQAIPGDHGMVSLEWVVPTETFSLKHPSGKLVQFHNEGMALRVTPDHRMLGWTRAGIQKIWTPTQFAEKVGYWANAGTMSTGAKVVDENLLRLAVAVQADGSFSGSDSIRFGFSKSRKIERLAAMLEGIPHTRHVRDGCTWFHLSRKAAAPIKAILDGKTLPWWWLDLTEDLRKAVLDEAQHWDSHKASNWQMYKVFSVDKQSMDVLQALASITGRKTRLVTVSPQNDTWQDQHHLSVRAQSTSRGDSVHTSEYDYTGDVACISVPSTFILVRDGGVSVIVGQSINFGILYGQGAHGLSGKLHIPLEEAEEMIRKYFAGLPVLKKWLDGVTAFAMEHGYVVNPFGRRRRVPRVKQWIPPRQNKPKGAPSCFGRKNGPPPFFKGALRQLDLKSNYPLNAGMLQAEAAKLHWSNPCATCPHISACVSNQEGNRREFEIAGLLREVGNFMIQSTATADLSGMAFSTCVIEARRHGIPLAIQDDVRGMVPVNIVHDELIFQVADEYVPGMTQLMHDVMTTIWPACTVKLETDTDVVQCWGAKHSSNGKLTDDDVRAQILAQGLEEYDWDNAGLDL